MADDGFRDRDAPRVLNAASPDIQNCKRTETTGRFNGVCNRRRAGDAERVRVARPLFQVGQERERVRERRNASRADIVVLRPDGVQHERPGPLIARVRRRLSYSSGDLNRALVP